jgi:hypothetical protein
VCEPDGQRATGGRRRAPSDDSGVEWHAQAQAQLAGGAIGRNIFGWITPRLQRALRGTMDKRVSKMGSERRAADDDDDNGQPAPWRRGGKWAPAAAGETTTRTVSRRE